MTNIPRCRKVFTFATVAALSHISGCMAGTRMIGELAALTTFVNKSSARPDAILAMRSAVAGAITIPSAVLANEICGTLDTFFHKSSCTSRPESASQVALPTKFRLERVGITVTRKPTSCRRRNKSADLYAAIPPPTPRISSRPRGGMSV